MTLWSILNYDFMQRALIAAILVGVTAPIVGIYLVQRRLSLIGDGLGHVALTGVAIGLLTGTSPVLTALITAVLGAVAVELIRLSGRAAADAVLAVLFYGGIAGGVVLIKLSPAGTPANLSSYLFGAIDSTRTEDLLIFAALSVIMLAVVIVLGSRLFAVINDEEWAQASGLPVRALSVLHAVLTAATVVISMRIVGLLLISALMIVPNAAAQQIANSFRTTMFVAIGVGLASTVIGTATSFAANTPPGGTIVLVAIAFFIVLVLAGSAVRALHARRQHAPNQHRHEHGPECGHEVLPHGDHVDYVHDGHRHAVHGAHYDDH